jgi:hypothetical protein
LAASSFSPELAQKILRPGEERILDQNSVDDRDRMGVEDVEREIGVPRRGAQFVDYVFPDIDR